MPTRNPCPERSLGGETRNSKIFYLFLLILAIGSGLRLYGLDRESLWNDELETVRQASFPTAAAVVAEGVGPDVHPPGHVLLTHFSMQLIGNDEAALRLPSAMAGILCIFAIFLLGKRLYTEREGLIAAACIAVLWFPLAYSQELRPYSWSLLFALTGFRCWLELVIAARDKQALPLGFAAGYVLSAAAGLYFHYFVGSLILLQGIWLGSMLLGQARSLLRAVAIYATIALLYMPWIPEMLADLGRPAFWIEAPGAGFFFEWMRQIFVYNPLATVLLLAVIALGLVMMLRRNADQLAAVPVIRWMGNPTVLLLFWLLDPFLLAFIKSLVGTPVLTYKNLIVLMPAAYLLLARALREIPVAARWRDAGAAALITIFLGYLFFVKQYYHRPEKDQFREAVAWTAHRTEHYRPALLIGHAWYPDYFDHYFQQMGNSSRIQHMAGYAKDIPTTRERIRNSDALFVIYLQGRLRADAEFIRFLDQEYFLLESVEMLESSVRVYGLKGDFLGLNCRKNSIPGGSISSAAARPCISPRRSPLSSP